MEKGFGHLFISSTSSHFFNKTNFEQYLVELRISFFKVLRLTFDFFQRQFAIFLKPPNKDYHHKAFYRNTLLRDQGAKVHLKLCDRGRCLYPLVSNP